MFDAKVKVNMKGSYSSRKLIQVAVLFNDLWEMQWPDGQCFKSQVKEVRMRDLAGSLSVMLLQKNPSLLVSLSTLGYIITYSTA